MTEIPFTPPESSSELSPTFIEKMTHSDQWDSVITRTSSDNLVGIVDDKVVKESKVTFASPEEAQSSLEYVQRSYDLFHRFLPEYTVASQFHINEGKAYIIQPFIDGRITNEFTDEEITKPELLTPFADLYRKLFTLYRSEVDATRYIPPEDRFTLTRINPIGVQAQDVRFKAPLRVLRSDNIMGNPETGHFYLFDFGRWVPWRPIMQNSYDRIVQKAQTKFEKYDTK